MPNWSKATSMNRLRSTATANLWLLTIPCITCFFIVMGIIILLPLSNCYCESIKRTLQSCDIVVDSCYLCLYGSDCLNICSQSHLHILNILVNGICCMVEHTCQIGLQCFIFPSADKLVVLLFL